METYNYQRLNQIINEQYRKIQTQEERNKLLFDKGYQMKLKEQEKSDNFYKNLIRAYKNPSYENLMLTAKIASTINEKEPEKDDRDTYTYIDKNYI